MSKETRVFCVDGINMQFNSDSFNNYFMSIKKRDEVKIQTFESKIGDILGVTRDAVHSWRFGQNGPADIEIIKQLAEYLNIPDYKILLKKRSSAVVTQITERQKDSLKKIYDAVIDYLNLFDETDGFNNLWHVYAANGVPTNKIESKLYAFAEDEQTKVIRVLQKEYIVLHKLDLYPLLEEYVNDFLGDIYNEKLSYAYRFEAGVEKIDGTRTTVETIEDYTAALNRINELLDPYMN